MSSSDYFHQCFNPAGFQKVVVAGSHTFFRSAVVSFSASKLATCCGTRGRTKVALQRGALPMKPALSRFLSAGLSAPKAGFCPTDQDLVSSGSGHAREGTPSEIQVGPWLRRDAYRGGYRQGNIGQGVPWPGLSFTQQV